MTATRSGSPVSPHCCNHQPSRRRHMAKNCIRVAWLLILGMTLISRGTIRTAGAQVDLYVGTHNFGEPTFHYNGETGAFISSFGSLPNERGYGIAVASNGDVWASYYDNGLIRRYNP